jgi:hypothetical protein
MSTGGAAETFRARRRRVEASKRSFILAIESAGLVSVVLVVVRSLWLFVRSFVL